MKQSPRRIIGIVFIVLSGIFFAIAGSVIIESILFKNGSIETQGTISRLIETTGTNGNTLYYAVFTFIDVKGLSHEITPNSATFPAIGQPGSRVKVLYHIVSPEDARIDGGFLSYIFPIVFSILAAIFLLIGVVTHLFFKRR